MVAAFYNNRKFLDLLVKSGKADLTVRDTSGDFAVHHAVKQSNLQCAALLLPRAQAADEKVINNKREEEREERREARICATKKTGN